MTPPCSESEFNSVLKLGRLAVLFQPIIDFATNNIKGYEALIRGPSDSPLHSPMNLFDTANRFGKLYDLEIMCQESCIRQFQQLNLQGKLFLNITPETLLNNDDVSNETLKLLKIYDMAPERLVIELTEHFPMHNYDIMRHATHLFKSMGFEIAIDDLGAGYAGLRMWSELDPDYVKIDRHFIQDIHEDPIKREFVRSIMDISKSLDCSVIAEGVETKSEFNSLYEMGIQFMQGYFFARPHTIPKQRMKIEKLTASLKQKKRCICIHLSEDISSIAIQNMTIPPEISLDLTGSIFRNSSTLKSLPVVNEINIPCGIVRRQKLMDILSTQYGLALHGKKSVIHFMDENPIIVDKTDSLEQVSRKVTDSKDVILENDFIITDEGKYFGVGCVMDLLKKITELQVRNARYANPLTLLPGNVPIYELVDRMLARSIDFYVAYCDIDNFKPFNDTYGYSKGDQILLCLASLLNESIDPKYDFVGHIGGDDFVVIFTSVDWENRCRTILSSFENRIPTFYDDDHRKMGGFYAQNRMGEKTFIPFITLSIGLAIPDHERCQSHHDVSALATGAKREAKSHYGNFLYIDRRKA